MIGKLSAWYRDNVSESVECVSCRLISGFGMLGIGAFLLSQAKRRRSPVEHYAMKSIAAGECNEGGIIETNSLIFVF